MVPWFFFFFFINHICFESCMSYLSFLPWFRVFKKGLDSFHPVEKRAKQHISLRLGKMLAPPQVCSQLPWKDGSPVIIWHFGTRPWWKQTYSCSSLSQTFSFSYPLEGLFLRGFLFFPAGNGPHIPSPFIFFPFLYSLHPTNTDWGSLCWGHSEGCDRSGVSWLKSLKAHRYYANNNHCGGLKTRTGWYRSIRGDTQPSPGDRGRKGF